VPRAGGSLCAAFALAAFAGALALASEVPIPPRPQTEVVDDAGALSSGAKSALETELESFESSTGHHVVVYIGQTTGGVPLETWTAQTAQSWKVGSKGKDDGAILFFFMKDHTVRVEVGYGLESTLTDAASNQIIQTVIIPRMKNGDIDGAISSGAAATLVAIDPSFSPTYTPEMAANGDTSPSDSGSDDGMGFWGWLVGGGVIFVALFGLFATFMNIVAGIARGFMIRREGTVAGAHDFKKSWLNFWVSDGTGSSSSSHGGFFSALGSGGGGGGFSGGSFGGGFGGGGASGSW
jgi:uncharacterized protein